MINTMKLLFKKKTYIVTGVIAPAMVILFFSFAFGGDMKYKVGVINKDNKYISNEVIESIREIEEVDVVDISKDNYEILLASHQIQIAVIIDEKTGNQKQIVRCENVRDIEQYISRIDEMIERKGELLWH